MKFSEQFSREADGIIYVKRSRAEELSAFLKLIRVRRMLSV